MKVLVTGAAGFIGAKVSYELASRGEDVVGVDNINDYYDVRLKYGRLTECGIISDDCDIPWGEYINSSKFSNLKFIRLSIDDKKSLDDLFVREQFDAVINLAAQAGVRYSITNPDVYIQSNIIGFFNILEACRHNSIKHLVYASSSSVYGQNVKVPFSETDRTDNPVSLYAATKKSNELLAFSYSKLYGIPVTGLRFFTVYGPWGRPDMAPMIFTKAIVNHETINVYNNGDMMRDFTYIDDIVNGVVNVLYKLPSSTNGDVPSRIYNVGCSNPVKLMDFIFELEKAIGISANINFMPMQAGDVYKTYADTSSLETEIGYKPSVTIHEGIRKFIDWYRSDKNPLR